MSEIFEGVLYLTDAEAKHDGVSDLSAFCTVTLQPGVHVIYRCDARQEARFSSAVDTLAANISTQYGRALLVRFDSRIGHRSSVLYVGGGLSSTFGETDELYVPLDDQGLPKIEVEPLHVDQLDPDQEYETVQNAIQRGLDALGDAQWEPLFRLITTA